MGTILRASREDIFEGTEIEQFMSEQKHQHMIQKVARSKLERHFTEQERLLVLKKVGF